MYKKWNLIIILALLLGLVLPGPKQYVSAEASATAEFTFTSTPNPSNFGQDVTFTLSATGTNPTYPPFGYVDFFDKGVAIPTCYNVPLNYPGSSPAAGYPAICTTSSLTVGTHTITAKFYSTIPDIYANNETLTLQNDQIVNDSILLTISPFPLMDAMLTVYYQNMLIASYPGGSRCENCTWSYQGELPDGIGLNAGTGELLGTPTTIETSTFTVIVDDGSGAHGSQTYTWNVTKAKSIIDVGASTTNFGSTQPTTLGANARHPDPMYWPRPTGEMSFSVDGIPVPGCSGTEAILTNEWGQAYCTGYIPTGLSAGSYQIHVDFTPDSVSSELYQDGSGNGTLQVNPPQSIVSGLVFMDDNQDGVKEETEVAQGAWNVYLNQDCDTFLEGNVVTDSNTGAFSFYPVPITNHTYCLFVDLSTFNGYVQTTPYNNLTLSGDQYFKIGVYYPHITILPSSEELLMGSVGTFFEQTFQISGGTLPYIIETSADLPSGLNFDLESLTLSGTPTAGGVEQFSIIVTDSDGISSSKDYSLKIMADGNFTFTSSSNPSALSEAVTFMVSATGEVDTPYGTLPPVGVVTFFADGNEIEGCSYLYLNAMLDENGDPKFGNYPASCTTDALGEGSHEITATYLDGFEVYNQPSLSLTQQVGVVSSLAISPETLAIAAYQTTYSQQLFASGGTEPYTFSMLSGTLPDGISLSSNGLLTGYPDTWLGSMYIGSYPITIQVEDASEIVASRDYEFVLDKGIPTVTTRTSAEIFWNSPFSLSAEVLKKSPDGNSYSLVGTVAFFIDGNPVPGCEAVPEVNSYYQCPNVSMDLAVGTHKVRAEYTPTGLYADYYFTASSDNSEFTVQPMNYVVQGSLFVDDDQNGINENEDRLFKDGWTINLDENCDGIIDDTTTTSWGGFSFSEVSSSGQHYCLTVIGEPGYTQTTPQSDLDFILTASKWVPIGFYYPTITLSPTESELPVGNVGVEYNQVFVASGGTEPYTYTFQENYFSSFPEGLTISADGVLSGTPIKAGTYNLTVQVEDANHATSLRNYYLAIKTDGFFAFTSSSNPSAPGDEVTFTVSATGDSLYPPAGVVTFYADGTPIESCSNMPLNLLLDENGYPFEMGDYPVICTTVALETGTHEITAIYTDLTGIYNEPTLALMQQVGIVEPLTILPETLPDAVYGTFLTQWLTVTCGEELSCGNIKWGLKSGSLPSGIQFESSGLISGSPVPVGSFTFTVEAYDSNDSTTSLGSKTYTWNVLKATPNVTFGEMVTYYGKTYLDVYVYHPNANWNVNPTGSVTVSVNGTPVEVCSNLSPLPDMPYHYSCITTDELVGLMPGSHALHADFTPDANTDLNYNIASGELTFTNPPRIEGLQFNDLDRDGIRDSGEESSNIGYVLLDRDCDGGPYAGTPADNSGQFSLNITSGYYCLSMQTYGKWYQSTTLEPFTVEADTYKFFEIGLYESLLTYNPIELPNASVGQSYSQTITISGGVPPYSLISANQTMPGDFTFDITFNESSFTISGAPTTFGEGYVSLELQDADGMKGNWNSTLVIKNGGDFNLTSSKNPSSSGEEVTFTFTGSGGAEIPDFGPVPPIGSVAFYDGEMLIPGCEYVMLNIDEYGNPGNFPATCTLSTLTEGTHTIKATFTDVTWFYNDAALALTQEVSLVSADLSIKNADSKDPVKPGSKLLYTLTVSNLGADPAESIIVSDKLDVTTTYLSVSAPKGWKCSYAENSGTVTCTSDSLASGSSAIIKITVMVNKTAKVGKELVNNALVSSSTFDPDLSNNTVVQKTLVMK